MEESIVAEQMLDLSLPPRVRSIDALDNILTLDSVLLAVQRGGLFVLALLLQARRLHWNHLSVHVQHLEALLLNLNNHSHSLGVNLDQVSKLILSQGINPGGHVCAELEVLRQSLGLVHGEVGEEDDEVLLHPDNQPRVSFVTTSNHPHVITLQWFL